MTNPYFFYFMKLISEPFLIIFMYMKSTIDTLILMWIIFTWVLALLTTGKGMCYISWQNCLFVAVTVVGIESLGASSMWHSLTSQIRQIKNILFSTQSMQGLWLMIT